MNELTAFRRRLEEFERSFDAKLSHVCDDVKRGQVREETYRLRRASAEDIPEIPVALLGTTGAGKSTLINCLVDALILPAAGVGVCTAGVTTVQWREPAGWSARLSFVTAEEWAAEVEAARTILCTEADPGDRTGEDQERREFEKKLRSVYRLSPDQQLTFPLPDLPEDAGSAMAESGGIELEREELGKLRTELKKYVTTGGGLWPLLRQAEIAGPVSALRNGAKLVDLPGLNDPNPAREAVTREYLKRAPYLWLVFNTNRGLTKDLRDFLVENDMIRRLMLEGKLAGFTLVATHADTVDRDDDTLDEFGLEAEATLEDVVEARNRRVREHAYDALLELAADIADRAGATSEERSTLVDALQKVPIFAVASKSYQRLSGLSKNNAPELALEATEIPKLRAHLERIAEGQDIPAHIAGLHARLTRLQSELELLFRSHREVLATRTVDAQDRRRLLRRACDAPALRLNARLGEVAGNVESKFRVHQDALQDRLAAATGSARQRVNETIGNWNQINPRTLQAVVLHDGRFRSANKKEYDLGRALTQPILQAIPFVWSDFFGSKLENLLALLESELPSAMELFLNQVEVETLRAQLADAQVSAILGQALGQVKESMRIQIAMVRGELDETIRRRQRDLAAGIVAAAGSAMSPAYSEAAVEKGKGMKARMLAILTTRAEEQADALFATIACDLRQGVQQLGAQLAEAAGRLRNYANSQSGQLIENLCRSDATEGALLERDSELERAIEALASMRPQHEGAYAGS